MKENPKPGDAIRVDAEAKDAKADAAVIADTTMCGDLLGALIDEIRTMPDVWQKTSEEKQAQIIERLTRRVESAVKTAVHIIASDGKPQIEVTLEGVTVKDKIKAALIIPNGSALLHDLIDSQGEQILVVLPRTSQYLGGTGGIKPDKDQPEIPLNTVQ